MKHCIFIYSDYVSGKRIGYHLQDTDGLILIKNTKKLEEELKKENPDIKCGVYFLKTESDTWDSVIEKDSFFKDVKIIKSKKNFFKHIENNEHLKKDDEKDIFNIIDSNQEDILSKISLISRRENLKLTKYELEDLELKDLKKFQLEIKNSIEKKEEILEKIKLLIPTFILTKEFFKVIEIINKNTILSIDEVNKKNFSEIYTYKLRLKEIDDILDHYMKIIKELLNSEAKSAKLVKEFIKKTEENKKNLQLNNTKK